eukprot:2659318-Rhodomonas_salina.1
MTNRTQTASTSRSSEPPRFMPWAPDHQWKVQSGLSQACIAEVELAGQNLEFGPCVLGLRVLISSCISSKYCSSVLGLDIIRPLSHSGEA